MTARGIEIACYILICILCWVLLVLGFLWLSGEAGAQENIPRGLGHSGHGSHWYDTGCCSMRDCEPVEPGAITMRSDGYHVRYLTSRGFIAEGIVPYGSSSIRPSKDHQEHACSTTQRILCIYLPLTM